MIDRLKITDEELQVATEKTGFTGRCEKESRLALLELIVKASAGYYNSHTEEAFLSEMNVMKKDRNPNQKGREFMMRMIYASSNKKPACFELMKEFRV